MVYLLLIILCTSYAYTADGYDTNDSNFVGRQKPSLFSVMVDASVAWSKALNYTSSPSSSTFTEKHQTFVHPVVAFSLEGRKQIALLAHGGMHNAADDVFYFPPKKVVTCVDCGNGTQKEIITFVEDKSVLNTASTISWQKWWFSAPQVERSAAPFRDSIVARPLPSIEVVLSPQVERSATPSRDPIVARPLPSIEIELSPQVERSATPSRDPIVARPLPSIEIEL